MNVTKNNRYTKETVEKKFCGVCKNAGKSEAVYTSHFIKSVQGPNGIVVCPTILQNKCFKCEKYGHFSDHCKNSKIEKVVLNHREEKQQSSYEELFPSLTASITGKKRDRNNQFTELRNIDTTIPEKITTKNSISYKDIVKTVFIQKEPEITHNFTVLVKGKKIEEEPKEQTFYDNSHYDFEENDDNEYYDDVIDDEYIDYDAEFLQKEEEEYNNYGNGKFIDAWD